LTGRVLTWRLTLAHLSSSASGSYVHLGAAGKVGPQVFRLCGPCTSPVAGKTTLTQPQVVSLIAGLTYVNVGTANNPHGEIRAQIRPQSSANGDANAVSAPHASHSSHASHVSHASHASHSSHSSHFSSG
jgi:hypothetical protein